MERNCKVYLDILSPETDLFTATKSFITVYKIGRGNYTHREYKRYILFSLIELMFPIIQNVNKYLCIICILFIITLLKNKYFFKKVL